MLPVPDSILKDFDDVLEKKGIAKELRPDFKKWLRSPETVSPAIVSLCVQWRLWEEGYVAKFDSTRWDETIAALASEIKTLQCDVLDVHPLPECGHGRRFFR